MRNMTGETQQADQPSADPTEERQLVQFLKSRNGRPSMLTTWNGERMQIQEVEEAPWLDPAVAEWAHFAVLGGIPLSADNRYSFYSTEIVLVEDVVTHAVVFTRPPHR